VSRLTPQQAHIVISTVNDRPVPESSEEFVGVVRVADIR
jgi:exosome complex component CSL4